MGLRPTEWNENPPEHSGHIFSNIGVGFRRCRRASAWRAAQKRGGSPEGLAHFDF
jgi:hypothetical protein